MSKETRKIKHDVSVELQRSHYLINTIPYERITHVLNEISKPELYYWYGKNGTKKCREIINETRSLGILTHTLIKRKLAGEDLNVKFDINAKKRLDTFKRWESTHKLSKYGLEQILYSHKWGVAGTADYIGNIDNELTIVDWKTSKDCYFSYPIQVAAYMHM